MRSVLLLPLAILMAAIRCGSDEIKPPATSVPERDLILQIQIPPPRLEIASRVELERDRAPRHTTRRPPEKTPLPSAPVEPSMVPAALIPVSTIPQAEPLTIFQPDPAGPVTESIDARELPPGKTVTVIPASSGPSLGADTGAELPPGAVPPMMRRGGGNRHSRGSAAY